MHRSDRPARRTWAWILHPATWWATADRCALLLPLRRPTTTHTTGTRRRGSSPVRPRPQSTGSADRAPSTRPPRSSILRRAAVSDGGDHGQHPAHRGRTRRRRQLTSLLRRPGTESCGVAAGRRRWPPARCCARAAARWLTPPSCWCSPALDLPLRGRSYRGIHLLHAYRAHPDYGRLPLALVAVAPPQDLKEPGPTEMVETFTEPAVVVAAVHRLLQPRPAAADHHGMRATAAG